MNHTYVRHKMGLSVGLAAALLLTGCAAIQRSEARSTEQLLAAAGFVMRPADTPERQQHLRRCRPTGSRVAPRTAELLYTYADPGGVPLPSTWADQGVLGISAAAGAESDRRGSSVGGATDPDGLGHVGRDLVALRACT